MQKFLRFCKLCPLFWKSTWNTTSSESLKTSIRCIFYMQLQLFHCWQWQHTSWNPAEIIFFFFFFFLPLAANYIIMNKCTDTVYLAFSCACMYSMCPKPEPGPKLQSLPINNSVGSFNYSPSSAYACYIWCAKLKSSWTLHNRDKGLKTRTHLPHFHLSTEQ